MEKGIRKSIAKFISLAIILLMAALIIKTRSSSDPFQNLLKYTESHKKTSPKIFFVGSSRMRMGIAVDQLEKIDSVRQFYNLGNNRSSILYNCRTAEKLIEVSPKNSLIYVELSDLLITPPNQHQYFYSFEESLEILKKHFALRFSFAELNELILQFFNFRLEIKNHFSDEERILNEIEYYADELNFHGGTSSIITQDDLTSTSNDLTIFQQKYLVMLRKVINRGKQKHIKVKFILPVTIDKASERSQTLPIYKNIPATNKWIYSAAFLEKIHSDFFLRDLNHLNARGAHLHTLELFKDIIATTGSQF
ncbi:hypothetical protein [Dyadobacter sp. LHD-138]|uniref:hypothetical protein n=1 Tax=Dyadobacter sp. LHD-138 TaxID=3071413 RepID=UPI0027E0D106|nr:hypothetical protein [Dyadobacter sp. LHD-138]MDQ6478324.1 hypothetical protein [Dyadobacter sp. LHD-138]